MDSLVNDATFELELDAETAEKFSVILNDESLMHAGFVAHQSNNNVLTLDLASVAYWYQSEPHAAFPPLPSKDALEIV